MVHLQTKPGPGTCDECNDPTYRPAPINWLVGKRELEAGGDLPTFDGLRTTSSALHELERLKRSGGRRWAQTRELLACLEGPSSIARTHRVERVPAIRETYFHSIENEPGVRIYWLPPTVQAALTVIAISRYDVTPER